MSQKDEFHLKDEDITELFDIVAELQDETAAAEEFLSTKRFAKNLAEIYNDLGEDVSSEVLEEAVQRYTDQQFAFESPALSSSGKRLASWYVNRGRIARRVGIPLLGAATIIGIAGVGLHAYELNQEALVEEAVQREHSEYKALSRQIELLAEDSLVAKLPSRQAQEFEANLTRAREELEQIEGLISPSYNDGDIKNGVTLENYKGLEKDLIRIEEQLDTIAKTYVGSAQEILKEQEDLGLTQSSLDSRIAYVRESSSIHPVFLQRANAAYENGVRAIEQRKLAAAQTSLREVEAIQEESSRFASLSLEIDPLHKSIKDIAQEQTALEQADLLYSHTQSHMMSADVNQLERSVKELKQLSTILNQEYSIRIVNKRGVNTGNWRYPTGPHAKSRSFYDRNQEMRNHYIMVEAVRRDGRVMRVPIRNEETGRVELVTMWGEGVSHTTYQKVGKDKKDNGLIDRSSTGKRKANADIMGQKERGYLGAKMDIEYFEFTGGQITRWDTTFR